MEPEPIELPVLPPDNIAFPILGMAYDEPNGLLAMGGDLSPARLIEAYARGIFPWFSDEQPILWWSPDPRMVIFPGELHQSRSMKKVMRKAPFSFSTDVAFSKVLEHCSRPEDPHGQWLIPQMRQAYEQLHQLGYAHSIEIWSGSTLAGGLYGVAMGSVFYGESMFSLVPNASKAALIALEAQCLALNYQLIDCQVATDHITRMGAVEIPREEFAEILDTAIPRDHGQARKGLWAQLPEPFNNSNAEDPGI